MYNEFFTAIRNGDLKEVERLLQANPDLIKACSAEGLSPILVAAHHFRTDIAEFLISHKVLLDIFEAAATGRVNHVVRILARNPELANAYSPDGFQPLGLAALFGHLEVVQFLLRAGVEINSLSLNALQATPINLAAAGGHPGVVQVLLDHGADPNARQSGGLTPLHIAAQKGNLQVALMLLLNGADLRLKTNEGKTALDLAQEGGHAEVVELLKTEITKRFRSARQALAR